MVSWTPSGPGRVEPSTPPGPLTRAPLDPLPPPAVPPAPPPGGGLPLAARVVVLLVLAAGNPWVSRPLTEWRFDLSDAEGFAALVAAPGEMILSALLALRWEVRITDDRQLPFWLAQNARTLVFVLVTVWLLRRLAAAVPAPSPVHRALAVFAAPVAGGALAAAGGVVLLVLLGAGDVYGYDRPQYVRGALVDGVHAGFVLGVFLAWVLPLLRPAPTGDPATVERR
ncbi:hypothetical protein AB0873_08775 [Micromonospora sp. NPDC047707]|uniref:hypothetical protein n=1 Tax=Micromonospora sp. NPDC047707 TaxID=3154498 RepID=UPI00345535F1